METMNEKRFFAACAAMTGLLGKYNLKTPDDQKMICQLSIELADELINQYKLKYENKLAN